MQTILIIILLYLLYRFVVGFVLPVATAANRIKKQFRDMQAGQGVGTDIPHTEQQTATFSKPAKQRTTSGKRAPKEDYIDYEEIPESKKY